MSETTYSYQYWGGTFAFLVCNSCGNVLQKDWAAKFVDAVKQGIGAFSDKHPVIERTGVYCNSECFCLHCCPHSKRCVLHDNGLPRLCRALRHALQIWVGKWLAALDVIGSDNHVAGDEAIEVGRQSVDEFSLSASCNHANLHADLLYCLHQCEYPWHQGCSGH